jgi:hypothetical protein
MKRLAVLRIPHSPAHELSAERHARSPWPPPLRASLGVALLLGVALSGVCHTAGAESGPMPGLAYTNCRVANVPWSIHTVTVDRANALLEIHSAHASNKAIGLETVSEQIDKVDKALGVPVAAINGDFYQRERAFAGAPRGLQILNGELMSAPSGGASFWIDALGQPHATNVASRFRVSWPGGTETPIGLNAERRTDGVVLYTAAVGSSTHTTGGRELVLERVAEGRWLPLRIGQLYTARVREIRETGNAPLTSDILVLSAGPAILNKLPAVQVGAALRISTESIPALRGVRTAIGGGPVLLRESRRVKADRVGSEEYEFSSMSERHPRTAIGWNQQRFFLVEVDGRQKHLSVGMDLDELSTYLRGLGCTDAMNLDGGGSATFWFEGEVRNSPCDRMEREVANSLVVVRKPSKFGMPTASDSVK